jgi:hypothetical protein
MRRLCLALMLAGCCLLAVGGTATPTREVQLERLAMHWPAGYTIVWTTDSTHLLRADGQQAIVSSYGPAPDADWPPLAAAAHRRLAELGAKQLEESAVRFGTVLAPLARAELPDGSILLSTASEKPGKPPRSYLLQFSVVGRAGSTAYITVEGEGAALPEYRRLLPLFQTVRWIRRNPLGDPAPEYDACARASPSFS